MTDRLFDPGPKAPSRWKNHPDKWIQKPGIVYHASHSPSLPRQSRPAPDSPLGYGDHEGMHFGTKAAAYERANATDAGGRSLIHTARLNSPRTHTMTDEQANFGHTATQAVRAGKAVPYVNSFEAEGQISYRVKPEGVRTWSEDIKADPNAHPALKHLADRGYNPTLHKNEMIDHTKRYYDMVKGSSTPQLFEADIVKGGKAIAHGTEDEMFARVMDPKSGVMGGVKRNNLGGQFTETAALEKAKPRMRPTR